MQSESRTVVYIKGDAPDLGDGPEGSIEATAEVRECRKLSFNMSAILPSV